jgi:chromosome partitioning protein
MRNQQSNDIEAAIPTLIAIRRLDRRFSFVLNQTPPRGCRLSEAATSLNSLGVLALSYVGQRNDHQDALGAGLGGVACGDNNEVQR